MAQLRLFTPSATCNRSFPFCSRRQLYPHLCLSPSSHFNTSTPSSAIRQASTLKSTMRYTPQPEALIQRLNMIVALSPISVASVEATAPPLAPASRRSQPFRQPSPCSEVPLAERHLLLHLLFGPPPVVPAGPRTRSFQRTLSRPSYPPAVWHLLLQQ